MINLKTFAGGELARKIDIELGKILNNIYDPDTEATKVRKLTATITFKPEKNRTTVEISAQVGSTLQPPVPTETNIIVDMDHRTDEVVATEIGNQMMGQVRIGENNDNKTPKKQEGVINLKTAKVNIVNGRE